MSKKDYIDAVNEIKVSDELKKETFNKIKQTPKKRRYNRVYPIASLAVMFAILMTIFIPNITISPIKEAKYEEISQTGELPKVQNFENLYAMLEKRVEKEENFIIEESVSADSVVTNSATGSKEEFSKTNVQVEGVDEADIVKTDGNFIYYLTNSELTITDVNNVKLASKVEFDNKEFSPQEIFLKDNKIVVIGITNRKVEKKNIANTEEYYPTNETYTTAKIYNIEDRTNPKLERTIELEGYYLSSRMIGDNVYLISNKNIYAYLCNYYKATQLDEEEFKPKYVDTATGESIKSINFDCIYYIPEFEDTNYLNIAAFNITNNEPASINSYLGAGNQMYASSTNLYITKTKYNYDDETDINTEIYKFNLKDATCTFSKTGEVPGSVLNQFSMDENNGYFRIATTDSTSWDSESNTNNLYVLNENLEIVGKVEGLAPGERIYSVRFMGNRAYMVTFVQTDPLFVIDLSDPTNPTVLGELKIPGYSTYLHPYDENHLIGFGENTKVVNYGYGDQVVTDGMKMALFDVTDPNNPTEMYSVNIGGKGTYSELLYNHKALLFSKEKNIIAFPISTTGEDYEVTFQGAIVYGLSLENGFEEKGRITNIENDINKYYPRNSIQRIIYINDTLYTLSRNLIKATDINTMQPKGSINLD